MFQRRFNGDVDFYRTLDDYRDGFGDPSGENWLGMYHATRLMGIIQAYTDSVPQGQPVLSDQQLHCQQK